VKLFRLNAAVLIGVIMSGVCAFAADINALIADKIKQYDPQAVSVTANVFDCQNADKFAAAEGGVIITLPEQVQSMSLITLTGMKGGSVQVMAGIEIVKPVLSAARTIKAGSMLTKDDFEVINKNTAGLNFSPVTSVTSVEGRQAAKVIQKGKILGRQDVTDAPDIATGNLVTIICTDDTMKLSTDGRAEESGRIGETIKVRNLKSKKLIMARVVDNNTVEVGVQ
jgi:flagella basal body P-ring formation protein FlgA